jgi:hypothetical protein
MFTEMLLPDAKKLRKGSKIFKCFVEVQRCRYLDRRGIEPSPADYKLC